ncbi:MAG: hypothetical protein GF383_01835 [Candidatus Lokiarchaeota archaeon]|nr:hypothetical protein [Candidatus Lokiarchaeota archaeon]MBD3338085.1 hypothetical protein [Candidatus Lokiarchaeota archaeon]
MGRRKKKEKRASLADTLRTKSEEKTKIKMDSAVKSAKNTETDLIGLLKGVSEGTGYYHREEDANEEERIEPKLTYKADNEIATQYAMEDIPLAERGPVGKRKPLIKEEEIKEKAEDDRDSSENSSEPLPEIELPKNGEESVEEKTAEEKAGKEIYSKLELFFTEFMKGYNERYNRWENSISNILSILRKMRKITKKNTEELIGSINKTYGKIQNSLDQFKFKRDEIEQVSEVDIETMSSEFKRVLGLLELQVKEYQLKRLSDECLHEYELYK